MARTTIEITITVLAEGEDDTGDEVRADGGYVWTALIPDGIDDDLPSTADGFIPFSDVPASVTDEELQEAVFDAFCSDTGYDGDDGDVDFNLPEGGDYEEPDESMDGDHESAMASAGQGTDEDYGYFGDDEEG